MAKSKSDLHAEAVAGGRIVEGTDPDDYSVADLEKVLSDDKPAWEGSLSSSAPIVQPDGHISLSKEDINARDS